MSLKSTVLFSSNKNEPYTKTVRRLTIYNYTHWFLPKGGKFRISQWDLHQVSAIAERIMRLVMSPAKKTTKL